MIAQAALTPAAASHLAGDVHGGLATFRFYGSSTSTYYGVDYALIRNATLLVHGNTIETTAWDLHLYKGDTAPATLADDAAWDLASDAERAKYLGKITFAQLVDIGSSLLIETTGINKPVPLHNGILYGYLVNGTTLTPQNVAHTVTLYASKDQF